MSQPGWYPDPAAPTMQRWWDGGAWTSAVQPVALPPTALPPTAIGPFGAPNPAQDLDEESKAGRWASIALVAGAVGYCGQYILVTTLFPSFWRSFRNQLNVPLNADGTRPPLVLPHVVAINASSSLLSLLLLAAGIGFIIWLYKAATVAQRLGLPARRTPGWAIGGWFIPFANFWFPYRSAVDCRPPGHPGRQVVKRWWTLWLVMSGVGIGLEVAAFSGNSPALWVVTVAGIVVVASAAQAGSAVIREVNRVHAGLLGR